MNIRPAMHSDVEAVVQLGKEMHSLGRFKNIRYDFTKCRQAVRHCVDNPGSFFFCIAETDEKEIIGLHMGMLQEYFFSNQVAAQSISFFVTPEYRGSSAALKMLYAFKKWAKKRNAIEVVFGTGISEGAPLAVMDNFMKRLGFELTGGNYGLWINTDQSVG
ncbi:MULTISPECIES: GNAT family N-acetyltransferase [unclassified Maridesulfovibrio]|uniref:GNAT family N-acetyltransferase n=1 Tax=unclassified Maridesulfovibrio TaxID=2794999 RepID=UPI003B3FFF3A